jgi:DNA-directed RNA polymerase specialized sigma24 family protein
LDSILRLSAPLLNNSLKTVLRYRTAILKNSINRKGGFVKSGEENPYGENVKMVRKIAQKQVYLTDAEKDGVVEKYETGFNMTEIARIYGCHYTTIGSILRKRGVAIRD